MLEVTEEELKDDMKNLLQNKSPIYPQNHKKRQELICIFAISSYLHKKNFKKKKKGVKDCSYEETSLQSLKSAPSKD